mmetsp:Transcript_47192/g.87700  ORF Transcript_47192/g.87700 Transcript_47192/m.87700 type:complete len:555 (-) Transcript_47192:21-1685(-)|eukprot:CAMPEP_0197445034 /NCGR_PEP_ID=MMETSP1175-20131217/10357_1 /TAXON_ID=1003142 /ORGANISM="Triceratium dubium, Strain CCMP147" /LENGTH=554 /DNA_ID=CAMNT_0042975933 /DNA_START=358 /DNA_END=2022 /DNA_ORIENTATION=+
MSVRPPALEAENLAGTQFTGADVSDRLSQNASFIATNASADLSAGEKQGEVCTKLESGSYEIDVRSTGSTRANDKLSEEQESMGTAGAVVVSSSISSCKKSNSKQPLDACVHDSSKNNPLTIHSDVGIIGSKPTVQSNNDAEPHGMTHTPASRSDSNVINPKTSSSENDQTRVVEDKNSESITGRATVTAAHEVGSISPAQKGTMHVNPLNHHSMKRPRPNSVPHNGLEQNLTPDVSRTKMAPPPKSLSRTSATLRRGKWTAEEEAYVAQVIHDFNAGFLNAPAGTTLRSYLSDKLQCDPMRITKKFTGADCIGKRVFHPAVRSASNAAVIDKAQLELDGLERRWRKRMEIQQKESAKKAAAAAASGRHNFSSDGFFANQTGAAFSAYQIQNSTIATMAKWLHRANAVLANDAEITENNQDFEASESAPASTVEIQLKEVEELIGLGPKIQQSVAGLPKLFKESPSLVSIGESSTSSHAVEDASSAPSKCSNVCPRDDTEEPQAKKPFAGQTSTSVGKHSKTMAKDAEALVGFINSVRSQNKSPDDKSMTEAES